MPTQKLAKTSLSKSFNRFCKRTSLRLQWRLKEHFVSCCGIQHDLAEVEKILDLFPDAVTWRSKDLGEMTGLMAAAFHGHDQILQRLIEKGADVNAQDNGGCTALHYALEWQHASVIKWLFLSDARLDIENKYGLTSNRMIDIDKIKCGLLGRYVDSAKDEIKRRNEEEARQKERKLKEDREDILLHGIKNAVPRLPRMKIIKPAAHRKK